MNQIKIENIMTIHGLLLISFILLGITGLFTGWSADHETIDAGSDGWQVVKLFNGQSTSSGVFQEAIAIDMDAQGNLYVLDRGLNRLVKFNGHGLFMKEAGGFGTGPDQFDDPRDVDSHLTLNIYVADYNNNRIVRYNSNLDFLGEFTPTIESEIYFEFPLSVAVNGQYDIFLLEDLNKSILKFNRFNQPLARFGTASDNLGQLLGPYQLTTGAGNEIFVSDPLKKAVLVFDYLGNFLREISHPEMLDPRGLSVSQRGELVVVDQKGQKVFFFDNGKRFRDVFDLSGLNIRPSDVTLWNPRGSERKMLYLSSAKSCYIFSTP